MPDPAPSVRGDLTSIRGDFISIRGDFTSIRGDLTSIRGDFKCSGCGYNLRGLTITGNCPECAKAVLQSLLNPRGLSRAQSLRAIGTGSFLIGAALLAGGACLAAEPFLLHRPWAFAGLSIAFVISAAGTWRFAAPASDSSRRPDRLSVAVRAAAVATCTLQLQNTVFALLSIGFVQMPMIQVTLFVWAITAVLTCARAAGLARQLGDVSGVIQAWLIAAISTATMLLIATTNWIGLSYPARCAMIAAAIVACVWSGIFFLGFALVLRRSANASASSDSSCDRSINEEQPCPTT